MNLYEEVNDEQYPDKEDLLEKGIRTVDYVISSMTVDGVLTDAPSKLSNS